jgi:hypothetical protein
MYVCGKEISGGKVRKILFLIKAGERISLGKILV